MADLVSPSVDIISRLWTCCARHTRYLCKLQENMILLRSAMKELKGARNDVHRRVIEEEADPNESNKRIDSVNGWLQNVEEIEGEVEVILKKAGEQLNRARCLGVCCPPNNCWSNYKLGKSIVKKIPLVDELKGKGHFEEVTYRLPPLPVQHMNLESTVCESMFNKVWKHITSKDHINFSIIGLYGLGGVGKTTLLKKINNEFNKVCGEPGFDHIVMFVVVSKPINYEAIQKKIGEKLGISFQVVEVESSRADKIFNQLRNKKNFVILLDDIWERVDLQRIGIPSPPPQNSSSKVIFTTRNKQVCGLMEAKHNTFQVECLPWDKAWSLFQDKVGEDALTSFQGARELAEIVARECGGLPLALITIGRAMSTKKSVEEWKDAITTLRNYASEFEGMRDEVLARLKLSYDHLPNETHKSCFRYCALFPEDYLIDIVKLVDYWIAEGFLDGSENKLDEARNRGHTIIGSLKSACLLESDEDPFMTPHVKMHDVIRDLAIWIVNDCRSSDESDSNPDNKFLVAGKDPCKKWENAERIFWDATHYTTSNNNHHPPTSPNLLTLIVQNNSNTCGYRLPQSFFQHMPLLRVLDLNYHFRKSVSFADEFPLNICELHELQYLNLSGTFIKELPVELRKLKFLGLMHEIVILRIPAGLIANFSELQVLNVVCFEDWELEGGPSFSELDGLKQLQEVRITIKTDVVLEKFLCNRKLHMVCTGLNYFKTSSSSRRVLDLSNFKSIKNLRIKGFGVLDEMEELVLYGSTTDGGLLSNLKILRLDSFPKLNSIQWTAAEQPDLLRSLHFQSLHWIWIANCDALKDLTWLVYVENLKTLVVRDCEGLETIIELGDDDTEGGAGGGDQMLNTGGGEGVFRRLNFLIMSDLPKLKSICRHALAFPSIRLIQVSKCPELKKLPLDSRSNINNTLHKIEGEEEWWNELQWEDETIKSKFLPLFHKEYLHSWV